MSSSPKKHERQPAVRQEQFLEVIGRDEAAARFHKHLKLEPLGWETVLLAAALNRVLAVVVVSDVDVPGFDRSNVDGFAVHAADTFGAMEEEPRSVVLNRAVISPGVEPRDAVLPGTATSIATGAVLPRGADAVVMIEHTEVAADNSVVARSPDRATAPTGGLPDDAGDLRSHSVRGQETRAQHETLHITRPVSPGENITFAGTDIAKGETVLWAGQVLTSREIGVLAAIGREEVDVYRRPQVAIVSTGNEIVAPGEARPPGFVYDSNLAILSAAVEELGAEPIPLGIVTDDEDRLQEVVNRALEYDAVLLSGGTSKGAGDLSYRVVSRFTDPGIVAHGVALKPGKPICLAVTGGKPVVVLPGFPTSAIFTFHEFVAPVLRALAGCRQQPKETVPATLPMRVNSERGRTEFLLVSLVRKVESRESRVQSQQQPTTLNSQLSTFAAYPIGKGSGSVTAFSHADGFITIPQQREILEAGSTVSVQLLGRSLEPADLVVIGSHCVGLDVLLGELQRRGISTKALHVGSTGGLTAAKRGECDLAGSHLMDPQTGEYNRPFLTPELELIPGYRRMQGMVFRPGDDRFEHKSADEAIRAALDDPQCTMINRNAGSGTRILIDRLLDGKRPPGYPVQAKSHNAVATAISQGRADWGLAIETVARQYGLGFLPVQEEHYDFVVPKDRLDRPALRTFRELLNEPHVRQRLQELGFRL